MRLVLQKEEEKVKKALEQRDQKASTLKKEHVRRQ